MRDRDIQAEVSETNGPGQVRHPGGVASSFIVIVSIVCACTISNPFAIRNQLVGCVVSLVSVVSTRQSVLEGLLPLQRYHEALR